MRTFRRLVVGLAAQYPNCTHVVDKGLAAASDQAVWRFARDNGFTIVSKDEDFQRFSILIWGAIWGAAESDLVALGQLLDRGHHPVAARAVWRDQPFHN